MLSNEVQAVLRQQGWSPERKVSIGNWVDQLASKGVTILPEAELILQNFGRLEINPVLTPTDAFAPSVVKFDPVTDVLSEVERIEYLQYRLAQKLTPLGVLYPSEGILLLSENGKIYFEYGNIFVVMGNTFEDAMESSLVFARRKSATYMINSEGKIVPL